MYIVVVKLLCSVKMAGEMENIYYDYRILRRRILTNTITAKSRPHGVKLITLMMTHLAIAP